MEVKHYSTPYLQANYQYFVEFENKRYIYNRIVDNKGSESFLVDSESNEPLSYESNFKLVDYLDEQFNNQTLHELEMVDG